MSLEISSYDLESLATPVSTPAKIMVLALSRPQKANALNRDMVEEATEKLRLWNADPRVRLLLITGRGKHFCAGADFDWMRQSADFEDNDHRHIAHGLDQFFTTLRDFDKPVVTYIRGSCVGGAMGIVALSDSVICHPSARFFFGETAAGLVPWVIYPYVKKLIPHSLLKRMILTGVPLTAEGAFDAGICHQVVADAVHVAQRESQSIVKEELNRLLARAPLALAASKNLLRAHCDTTQEFRQKLRKTLKGEESKLGMQCFLDDSVPPWSYGLPEQTHINLGEEL